MKALPTFCLLVAAVFGFALSAGAQQITLKGSDTMVILNQKWSEEYMKKNPGVSIQVTGGGSGTGLAALKNGTTDVAASSRQMKSKETQDFLVQFGGKPLCYEVALDGLAVYVHASNPVKELTVEQVAQLYLGKITNWKQLGGDDVPVVLYGRESNSGTYGYFKEFVLKESDFSPQTQTLAGTGAVIDAVSKDNKGVGYGGIAYSHHVKALPLRFDNSPNSVAVLPTMENVESRKYPLSRPLYFYVSPKNTRPELAAFIRWVTGKEGQKVVTDVGYYPLPGAVAANDKDKEKDKGKEASQAPKPAPVSAPVAAAEAKPAPKPELRPEPTAPVAPAPATVPAETPAIPAQSVAATKEERPVAPQPAASPDEIAALTRREAALRNRESSVAEREDEVAKREAAVASREIAMRRAYRGR